MPSLRSLIQQLSQEQEQDEARAFLHHVGSPLADSPPGMSMKHHLQQSLSVTSLVMIVCYG